MVRKGGREGAFVIEHVQEGGIICPREREIERFILHSDGNFIIQNQGHHEV